MLRGDNKSASPPVASWLRKKKYGGGRWIMLFDGKPQSSQAQLLPVFPFFFFLFFRHNYRRFHLDTGGSRKINISSPRPWMALETEQRDILWFSCSSFSSPLMIIHLANTSKQNNGNFYSLFWYPSTLDIRIDQICKPHGKKTKHSQSGGGRRQRSTSSLCIPSKKYAYARAHTYTHIYIYMEKIKSLVCI